jgi:hypothetical protein
MNESIRPCPPDGAMPGWPAARRAPRPCDDALTGTTRNWLRRLPARRRPLRLCERFPRVANRIAWCWADARLAEQVLDDLLVDRRGGREGFPPAIVAELRRLREFNDRQRNEPPAQGFWAALRHTLD